MKVSKPKVSIIGAGNVGSTFAFNLMLSGLAREIGVQAQEDQRHVLVEIVDVQIRHASPASTGLQGFPEALSIS